jgi:primary-amine oxidase
MTGLLQAHRSKVVLIGALALLAAVTPFAIRAADAQSEGLDSCSAEFTVDETLPSGARWQMCWEEAAFEGIILHDVFYTPPGGEATLVLAQAHLAQIHVPYDNNWARFHDVSDYGLGGGNMNDLVPEECPGGSLLQDGSKDVLCQTVGNEGYAYKDYDEQEQSTSLNLFSVSHIGAYNYVVAWSFDDDGTIRPEVGATGQLQLYGGDTSTGWAMGGGNVAVAHMHNFFWRLDFDIDGSANDRVSEMQASFSANREQVTNGAVPITTESARRVAPSNMRSWRIRDTVATNADGHQISWDLLPNTDHIYRGPTYEQFTQNEVYVTRYRACERFASHNPGGGGCASNGSVASFVNGESLSGQDLVLWYGTSFHHLPRDEDEDHMHPHWSGFSIVPRNLTATNPLD